ncbi:MAG: SDR family oxidoreductase [Myxococcales bacterium]|jgi:NAD(P)-dependent dehydrogenase (short-subunit alcohol dehydrogenase family)
MATALIIGSNRGIGLEITEQLARRGDRVIAACRKDSPELKQIDGVQIETGIDVTDAAALAGLADRLGDGSLDLMVVVAGILEGTSLHDLDVDSVRRQFEVNAVGPLLATASLRHCLAPGAKLGLVTSRMGSIEDNTSGGSYGYRMSKAALNAAGRSLAHDLKEQKVAVQLLHPGFVRTEMTGGSGFIDPGESAAGLIARLDELTLERTGTFVHQNGESLPW